MLLFGECDVAAGGARIFATGGADDAGTPYSMRAVSNWLAPMGAGEVVFRKARITVTWSGTCQLLVTPLVDALGTDDQAVGLGLLRLLTPTITLPAVTGEPRTDTFEVMLQRAWLVGGIERTRYYLRGTRLRLAVETVGPLAGVLVIDGPELDYSPAGIVRQELAAG